MVKTFTLIFSSVTPNIVILSHQYDKVQYVVSHYYKEPGLNVLVATFVPVDKKEYADY